MALKRKDPGIAIFSLEEILELIVFSKTDLNIVSIRDSIYLDYVDWSKKSDARLMSTYFKQSKLPGVTESSA